MNKRRWVGYGIIFLAGTLVFILLFHTGLFKGEILFFRGLMLLALAGLLMTLTMLILKKPIKDILVLVTIFLCLILVFFTLVPVTLDRSISVYLLNYFDEQDKVLSKENVSTEFINNYVNKNQALDKRFNEQLVSKNISKENGGYRITPQGKIVVNFFRIVSKWFGI